VGRAGGEARAGMMTKLDLYNPGTLSEDPEIDLHQTEVLVESANTARTGIELEIKQTENQLAILLVHIRREELTNFVALYTSPGGGWK
jgi:hypothetical protein